MVKWLGYDNKLDSWIPNNTMTTEGPFDEIDITNPMPREEVEMQDMNDYVNTDLEHQLYIKNLKITFQELVKRITWNSAFRKDKTQGLYHQEKILLSSFW